MQRTSSSYPPYFRKTSLALAIAATLALPTAFAAPGDPVGGEFRVNTTTLGSQDRPAATMDADGDAVVVWTSGSQNGYSSNIFAQRLNNAGVKQGPEFWVNTPSSHNRAFAPDVAMDADGDYIVTWTSIAPVTNNTSIRAQRFTKEGTKQGSEFRVDSTRRSPGRSAVAMDADGDFIVTWTNDRDILARRYNNVGVAQGDEFLVSNTGIYETDVAMDADGDSVVTWTDTQGITARRYNNIGVAQGGKFVVNTPAPEELNGYPTVAMDSDGDFVVAWSGGRVVSYYEAFYDFNIFAQRYNSAGVKQGAKITVNGAEDLAQNNPSVAIDADGDFVIAWSKVASASFTPQPIYDIDIAARRYNKTGVPQGNEFRVNTTTANEQKSPAVAVDADGDFVVTWQSYLQDGDRSGIFAQRYAGPGYGISCDGRAVTLVGTAGADTLIGTAGDDVIAGLGGNDTLNGLGGNDRLCGNEGNDRLVGGSGNDIISGGPGTDTADFGGAVAGVTVNLAATTATGEGSDRLFTIENVWGSPVSDNLTGNANWNLLVGFGGNDILNGAGGPDVLLGGNGNDNLNGGTEADLCDGQGGTADRAINCETVRNVP